MSEITEEVNCVPSGEPGTSGSNYWRGLMCAICDTLDKWIKLLGRVIGLSVVPGTSGSKY